MKKLPLLFDDHPPGVAPAPAPRRLAHGLVLIVLIFAGTRLVTWTGT